MILLVLIWWLTLEQYFIAIVRLGYDHHTCWGCRLELLLLLLLYKALVIESLINILMFLGRGTCRVVVATKRWVIWYEIIDNVLLLLWLIVYNVICIVLEMMLLHNTASIL